MRQVSRRSVLVAGSLGVAGVASAKVARAGALAGGGTVVRASDPGTGQEPSEVDPVSEPVLLVVRDASSGEVELLVDERAIVFTDKRLAAQLLQAAH
jgi:hypothetical protein